MARRPQLGTFARTHGLKLGSVEDLIRHRRHSERAEAGSTLDAAR